MQIVKFTIKEFVIIYLNLLITKFNHVQYFFQEKKKKEKEMK